MTPHQIVAVALRLFAVWLGIQTLRTLPAFFAVNSSDAPGYVYAVFMFALTAVLVLAFWFFPRAITGKLLPHGVAESQPAVTADTWLAMGCSLIGLWILTTTIPRLVFDTFALNSMSNSMSSFEDRSQLLRGVLWELGQLAIAIWLVLGGKGFRKLFWWAQNAATRKAL
jgi:hypothetical protein